MKYIELLKYVLLIPLGIVVAVAFFFAGCFLGVDSVLAFEDSFELSEGYQDGEGIDEINGWDTSSGQSDYWVDYREAYDGYYSLYNPSDNSLFASRSFSQTATGTQCVSVFFTGVGDYEPFYVMSLENSGSYASMRINPNLDVLIWYGAWLQFSDPVTKAVLNDWNNFCISWDVSFDILIFSFNGVSKFASTNLTVSPNRLVLNSWQGIEEGAHTYYDFFTSDFDAEPFVPQFLIEESPTPESLSALFTGTCAYTPCLLVNQYQYCAIDSEDPCKLRIDYNDFMKGAPINLLPYGLQEYSDSVSSTTLSEVLNYDYLEIPKATSTPSNQKFSLLSAVTDYGDFLYSWIWVEYVLLNDIAENPEWTITKQKCNCDSIATSSGTFGDDMRYGIECGAYKAGCLLFIPSDYHLNLFQKSSEVFSTQFPVSVIIQIKDLVASSSVASVEGIRIPLKWWDNETKTYKDQGVNLLSTSTLAVGMGTELYTKYYYWATNFIYLSGFLYVLARIIRRSNPHFGARFPFGGRHTESEEQIIGTVMKGGKSVSLDSNITRYRTRR